MAGEEEAGRWWRGRRRRGRGPGGAAPPGPGLGLGLLLGGAARLGGARAQLPPPLCRYDQVNEIPSFPDRIGESDETADNNLERRYTHSLDCVVPLPRAYQTPVKWPRSRDEIHAENVEMVGVLARKKAKQRWVTLDKDGKTARFPGGGTHFTKGAEGYVDSIATAIQLLKRGGHMIRTALDMGSGVASFGDRFIEQYDVLTLSYSTLWQHQIQMALERGLPAFVNILKTKRLPLASQSFDLIHCSRCRQMVPGQQLIEVDRLLKPGGFIVNSNAYWKRRRNIKEARIAYMETLCYNKYAEFNSGYTIVFQKLHPSHCKREDAVPYCDTELSHFELYGSTIKQCREPNPLVYMPHTWPLRKADPNVAASGMTAQELKEAIARDTQVWDKRLADVDRNFQLGITQSTACDGCPGNRANGNIRNVMHVNAKLGGFAAALHSQGMPFWVMNTVPTSEEDTLQAINSRGFVGIYQDWCQDFPSYPRTYDLIYLEDFTVSLLCPKERLALELDRLLRPHAFLVVQADISTMEKYKAAFERVQWKREGRFTDGVTEYQLWKKPFYFSATPPV